MVRTENFTDKTNELLLGAQQLAQDSAHIQLLPIHVAVALFAEQNGLGTCLNTHWYSANLLAYSNCQANKCASRLAPTGRP